MATTRRHKHESEHERHERWFTRIEHKLDAILTKENLIMADQAALDAAIASLKTAVDAIVAALQNVPQADFTAEVAALQAATDEIGAALTPPTP